MKGKDQIKTEALDNISFRLLLQQHGGDVRRATEAWEKICQLGNFGNIPTSYEGGLDIKSLRIYRDEVDQGGNPEFAVTSRGVNEKINIQTGQLFQQDRPAPAA